MNYIDRFSTPARTEPRSPCSWFTPEVWRRMGLIQSSYMATEALRLPYSHSISQYWTHWFPPLHFFLFTLKCSWEETELIIARLRWLFWWFGRTVVEINVNMSLWRLFLSMKIMSGIYLLLFPLCVLRVGSVAYLLFVRRLGGILAVANIRGGGEYGLTWHKGPEGTKLTHCSLLSQLLNVAALCLQLAH